MSALKNLEALVLVAIAVTFSATALVRTPADAPATQIVAKEDKMIQVVVSAKRLTPAEKAQLAG